MPAFTTLGSQSVYTQSTIFGSRGGAVSDGTANTKGSYDQLFLSTPFDASFLYLSILNVSTTTHDALLDIATGSSGSEQIIIPDIQYTMDEYMSRHFYFPVHIPAGSRLATRLQTTSGSITHYCNIKLIGGTLLAPPPLSTSVESLQSSTSDSGGIQIDPGGTANTKGSWVELDSAANDDVKAMILNIGYRANGATGDISWSVDVGIGGSGSEVVVIPDLFLRTQGDEKYNSFGGILPITIAKGERIAVRAQCSSTNAVDRLIDASMILIQ